MQVIIPIATAALAVVKILDLVSHKASYAQGRLFFFFGSRRFKIASTILIQDFLRFFHATPREKSFLL